MNSRLRKRIKTATTLGATKVDQIKIVMLTFLFFINHRLHLFKNRAFRVRLKFANQFFLFYFTDNSDLAVLEEVFIDQEYYFPLENIPKVIFDLGSNVGLSVIYFKLLYPRAMIYCFEPDPETFKKLEKNLLGYDDIFCFNLAIADKAEKIKFYRYLDSSISSSLIPRMANQEAIIVEGDSLSNIVSKDKIEKIDLLKFDVEGAEFAIFKDPSLLLLIENFVGEVHEDLAKKSIGEFKNCFSPSDFDFEEILLGPKRYLVKIRRRLI